MANRLDWNVIDEKIKLTMSDWDDIDNRSKSLTVVALSTLLDISIEEAIDALTDGGNDRGVDALFIDNRDNINDIHIFQSKCVQTFNKSKNNFPGSEVDKVVSFVSDLLSEEMGALNSANDRLYQKIEDAIQTLKQTNATLTVHFVCNQRALPQQELERIQIKFRRYRAVEFEMHDLDSLSDFFLVQNVPSIDREITVIDKNYFDRTDLDLRAMVCTVAASDIVEAIRSESDPDDIEIGIFDQNVRVYLKRQNRINRRIFESALSDENHMFWYQNNGITITCDKLTVAPTKRSPKIKLTNIQIVNGGQTSNCLFEASKENPEKLEDVVVLVRIIETSSEDVKHLIAEATNSQTSINARDLRANDRQQKLFETTFSDLGYFYERKSNQYAKEDKDKRIDAFDAAQAYLAFGLGLPEVARKDRGRIFGDLYDTVFSDELTVQKLLKSYNLLKLINKRKSALRAKLRRNESIYKGGLALIDGAFHVIFALSQMITSRGHEVWEYEISDNDIDDAIDVVEKYYIHAEETDPNFSSNKLFKDRHTKDQIVIGVANKWSSSDLN